MITNIKLSALRNSEFVELIQHILEITRENDPVQLNVQPQYEQLREVFEQLESLYKVPTGNVISTELEELDLRRDNALNGVLYIVNAHLYSSDANARSNAAVLSTHLSMFGSGLARQNYQSETMSIRNIISDWDEKPAIKAAYEALGLQSWRTELEQANNLFGQRFRSRSMEMGNATPESIRSKRMEAYEIYYQFRDHLNAHFIINKGIPPYGIVVGGMNDVLERFDNIISHRAPGEPEAGQEKTLAV